ncbi:MAG: hypothetical protein RIG26_12360 [Thalassospira sp.]|uniref:hypothetical protein n=1 Tax=Thalassospira sp. TaxID=1912094 RepID=UPI0032EE75C5
MNAALIFRRGVFIFNQRVGRSPQLVSGMQKSLTFLTPVKIYQIVNFVFIYQWIGVAERGEKAPKRQFLWRSHL